LKLFSHLYGFSLIERLAGAGDVENVDGFAAFCVDEYGFNIAATLGEKRERL